MQLRSGQTILGLAIVHTPTESAVSGVRIACNARATPVLSHAVRGVVLLFRLSSQGLIFSDTLTTITWCSYFLPLPYLTVNLPHTNFKQTGACLSQMVILIFWCIEGRPTELGGTVRLWEQLYMFSKSRGIYHPPVKSLHTFFFKSTIGARRSQNNVLHGTRSENKKSIALIQTVRWEM